MVAVAKSRSTGECGTARSLLIAYTVALPGVDPDVTVVTAWPLPLVGPLVRVWLAIKPVAHVLADTHFKIRTTIIAPWSFHRGAVNRYVPPELIVAIIGAKVIAPAV